MTTTLEFVISAVDKASGVFNDTGNAAKGMGDKFLAVGTAVGTGVAAVKVVDFGRDSVAAYTESQTAAEELQYALNQFPTAADTNAERLMNLNSALALKTKFDDDATASGQATLAQFQLTGAQIEQLTPLMQDYAARTGKDLPAAADDLGKAMLGQGRALKAIGIDFQDTGSVAGNFDAVVAGLRTQVGGFAEQQGATAAGTADRMANSFGELQEMVGGELTPAVQNLTEKGIALLGWMQEHEGATKAVVGIVGLLVVAYAGLSAASTISAGISAIRGTSLAAETVATTTATAANTGFAASMWAASWPVLAVVAAVALLAGGVYLVVKNWDGISAWFGELFDSIGGKLGGLWDGIKTVFGWSPLGYVIEHWGDLMDFFGKLGGWLADGFRTGLHDVAVLWNSTLGALSWTAPAWLGGWTIDVPDIPVPKLALGGIATRPTLALIGEAGTEAVVPLNRASEFGFGGGGANGRVTVEVPVYIDGREVGRATAEAELRNR